MLKRATMSAILNGDRVALPDWRFVSEFVGACRAAAAEYKLDLEELGSLADWKRYWDRASAGDLAQSPVAPSNPSRQEGGVRAGEDAPHVRSEPAEDDSDDPTLLLRIYVPVSRLYAAEEERLLSMFREWLATVRNIRIREGGYQTKSGKVYEFYYGQPGTLDLPQEVQGFSGFVTLCVSDPDAARDQLARMGLDAATASSLADRYGREVRRMNRDLRHEREKRILAICHEVEEELLESTTHRADSGSALTRDQIVDLVETLVPALPENATQSIFKTSAAVPAVPIAINISQQTINTVEGHVIQGVQGAGRLGVRASELLAIIAKQGGEDFASLESAVHEIEDRNAPPPNRRVAKEKLLAFLRQLGEATQGAAIAVLQKYVESKI